MSTSIGQGDWPYYPRKTSDGPAFVPVMTPADPPPRPWPFPVQTPAPQPELDDEDDSPYCLCGDLPTQAEIDANKCATCWMPLK